MLHESIYINYKSKNNSFKVLERHNREGETAGAAAFCLISGTRCSLPAGTLQQLLSALQGSWLRCGL